MDDPRGVSIGQAAALYGLAPSTLRWWEAQGVLPPPPRANGRRVYTETELRRIGLAYLCSVVGTMPLDQVSVVTSGSRNQHWRRTVRGHAGVIEEKIRRLRGAHRYLVHLALCPDDDIVSECPDLDEELVSHTPRGRVATPGLVAAAQSITPDPMQRDEKKPTSDEKTASAGRCAVCTRPLSPAARGRRPRYCSRACQQRQYRRNARRAG